jgi:hypothetical protein
MQKLNLLTLDPFAGMTFDGGKMDKVDMIDAQIDFNLTPAGIAAKKAKIDNTIKETAARNTQTNIDMAGMAMQSDNPAESEFIKVLIAQQKLDAEEAQRKKEGLAKDPFFEMAQDVMKSLIS